MWQASAELDFSLATGGLRDSMKTEQGPKIGLFIMELLGFFIEILKVNAAMRTLLRHQRNGTGVRHLFPE